jgi:putative peptide zinc metalloprotease protein
MDRTVTPAAAIPAPPASKLPAQLPPLREDLQLHPGAPHADGSPAWVIQDPISNAFYRIGWLEFELLSRWSLGDPQAIVAATAAETLLTPTLEEIEALYLFLLQSQLLTIHETRHTRELVARFRASKQNRVKWLLHHYLFFRLPIIHPDAALQRALPWLGWIFTRMTALTVLGLSLLGLVLTARQWDVFLASFMDTLSPGGIAAYLVALAVTKSLHELGHALTATRYGLRVAHMGVAFVVLWPMLYTDTGESWRLSDNRQRLRIASAGILTEMAIAGLATLAWHLTSDGDLKQALFFLATTAWVLTLALNISPFMRFDGYFILSDALDMPNLHERSFALARTALRNTLLGWQEPDPEPMAPGPRRLMIAFAIATWLYRLVLFIGIAIAVYLFFFKLLGIFLFAVEIWWFVLLPMWRELKVWHARRSEISAYRQRSTAAVLLVLLLIALVPWGYQVRGQGYAHPAQVHTFYSPLPARLLERPASGGTVDAGQAIFTLEQPELAYRSQLARASMDALDSQLRGLAALPDGEERRRGLSTLWAMHTAEMQAQAEEANRLVLTAPFAGVLTDLDHEIATGTWVGTRQPLAVLVAPDRWQAELLISQDHLERIDRNSPVRFYPEGQRLFPLSGRVVDIENVRTSQLPHALLSSQHGGTIPVVPDQRGLTPRDALYRVRVELSEAPAGLKMLRGEAIIEGQPESWLLSALKPVLIVLLRELSF